MKSCEIFSLSAAVLLSRIMGALVSIILTAVLAKSLGPKLFGVFSLALTLITILSVVSRWGLDVVLLKQVSVFIKKKPEVALGYIRSSFIFLIAVGLILTSTLFLYSEFVSVTIFKTPQLKSVLELLIFATIPMSFINVLSDVFKAIGRPVLASYVQHFIVQFSCLLLVFLSFMFADYTLELTTLIYVAVYIFYFFVFLVLLVRFLPNVEVSFKPIRQVSIEGWPLLLLSFSSLLMSWSDLLVLGLFERPEQVGIFTVATRIALVVSLALVAINSITAPRYALLYSEGSIEEISNIAQKTSAILFVFMLVPALIFLLFSSEIMSLISEEYASGGGVLLILVLGQIVNVVCGPVGYLLSMTGKEKTLKNIVFITAVINLFLSLLFVKLLGVQGVAIATTLSVITWNVWAVIEVRKHLGFWTINFKRKYFTGL